MRCCSFAFTFQATFSTSNFNMFDVIAVICWFNCTMVALACWYCCAGELRKDVVPPLGDCNALGVVGVVGVLSVLDVVGVVGVLGVLGVRD